MRGGAPGDSAARNDALNVTLSNYTETGFLHAGWYSILTEETRFLMLAERQGFEPWVTQKSHNGFRDRPDQPLWHLSVRSRRN